MGHMKRKLLYYPTILIPMEWMKCSILYWDSIASIVPEDLDLMEISGERELESFSCMKYLKDEQIYIPSKPDDIFPKDEKSLNAEFLSIVNTPEYLTEARKRVTQSYWWSLYESKATVEIIGFLIDNGIAKRDCFLGIYGSTILVEPYTAFLYMGLLAKYLSDYDGDFTVPNTDNKDFQDIVYSSNIKNGSYYSLNIGMPNLLPVPVNDVPVPDILDFRNRRREELLNFREYIDDVQKELSHTESESEIKEIINNHNEKSEKEILIIERLMKESKFKTVRTSISSLISVKSPVLYEAIALKACNADVHLSIPIIASTALIQIGISAIDEKNRKRAEVRKNPFAYIYEAKKARIL